MLKCSWEDKETGHQGNCEEQSWAISVPFLLKTQLDWGGAGV